MTESPKHPSPENIENAIADDGAVEQDPPTGSCAITQLADRIASTFGRMTQQKAALLRDIGIFDKLRLARRLGATTTAQWLIRRLGISKSTAHEYVSIARDLMCYSLLAEVFNEGDVNYSKVRLLLPYLKHNDEAELVELAIKLGYHELEAELAWRQREGEEGESKPSSYVRIAERKNGRFGLWADLSPLEGAKVAAALKIGELSYYDVDLAEVVERDGVDEALKEMTNQSGFGLPVGKAMLAAFMGMVNVVRSKPKNPLRAPGAHVNIVTTTDGRAYMPNGVGEASISIAHAVSNAIVRVNEVNDQGLIINTSKSARLANDAQLNALMTMWGSECAVPGCTHTRFIEVHHVEDWALGGETTMENLLPLCSACHSLVTEGHTRIIKDADDVHFVFPDGTRFISPSYQRPYRDDNAMTMREYEDLWIEEYERLG